MNFDPVHWSLCLGCWSANLGSLHSCFGSGESCHLLFQTGTFASNAGSLHWPYCICFADRCWLVCSKLMPKCCDLKQKNEKYKLQEYRLQVLTSSVFCKSHELIGSLSLVVTWLGSWGLIRQFLGRQRGQLFLDQETLLNDSGVAKSLTCIGDFIISRGVDLEAEFRWVLEVPVPELHIVATCNSILGRRHVLHYSSHTSPRH